MGAFVDFRFVLVEVWCWLEVHAVYLSVNSWERSASRYRTSNEVEKRATSPRPGPTAAGDGYSSGTFTVPGCPTHGVGKCQVEVGILPTALETHCDVTGATARLDPERTFTVRVWVGSLGPRHPGR